MAIIEVEHLTKEYRLGQIQGLKTAFLNAGRRLLGHPTEERLPFKALDDVSFSIEQGEVVGIIGHNGAGKSTLLKMLAGITTPTSGSVKVDGRIAPLIEVGAGFVPDFTGRENVYLNGSILGLSKKEIDRKFDEIVDFAEMSQFIDTPVKRYSSGMQVKLAFAVATSIESEILIVDEVLAVGDLAFQRKCFDRMEDLIKRQEKTVLLVSHNIRQVERLCSRVILMNHGRTMMDGTPKAVCNVFYEESDRQIAIQKTGPGRLQTTGEAEIIDIYCTRFDGTRTDAIEFGQPIRIVAKIEATKPLISPLFVVGIHTTDFIYLTTTTSSDNYRHMTLPPGPHEIALNIDRFPLLPNVYSIRLSIDVETPIKNVLYGENLHHFTVRSSGLQRSGSNCEGFFPFEKCTWTLDQVAGDLPPRPASSLTG